MLPNLNSKTFRLDFNDYLAQRSHFKAKESGAQRGLAEFIGLYNIICNNFVKDLVIISSCSFQNVVLRIAVLASPGNFLDMQILGL